MFALIAERAVHQILSPWQHSGEWFTATPEMAKTAIRMICEEMPHVIRTHRELDAMRVDARIKRRGVNAHRREMHTAVADEVFAAHKAKIMGALFPPRDDAKA